MRPEQEKRFAILAIRQLGKPYSVHYKSHDWVDDKGLKKDAKNLYDFSADPVQFDCSGLSAWLWGVARRLRIPHGTQAQQDVCRRIDKSAVLECGDLGFIERSTGRRHVVVYLYDDTCIEANGKARKVITAEATRWQKDPDFLGWYRLDEEKLAAWKKGTLSK